MTHADAVTKADAHVATCIAANPGNAKWSDEYRTSIWYRAYWGFRGR